MLRLQAAARCHTARHDDNARTVPAIVRSFHRSAILPPRSHTRGAVNRTGGTKTSLSYHAEPGPLGRTGAVEEPSFTAPPRIWGG